MSGVLLQAGARVALFDLGDTYGDPDDGGPAALLAEFPGGVVYVGELHGRRVRSALTGDDDPWAGVFEVVAEAFGYQPKTVW